MLTHAIDLVVAAILFLAGLVMTVIGVIDSYLSAIMTYAGLPPLFQTIILIAVALWLIVLAVRLLGGVFSGLIIVLLLLMVLHRLFPHLEILPPNTHTTPEPAGAVHI
jgi:hypothetical protein